MARRSDPQVVLQKAGLDMKCASGAANGNTPVCGWSAYAVAVPTRLRRPPGGRISRGRRHSRLDYSQRCLHSPQVTTRSSSASHSRRSSLSRPPFRWRGASRWRRRRCGRGFLRRREAPALCLLRRPYCAVHRRPYPGEQRRNAGGLARRALHGIGSGRTSAQV